MTVAISRSRHAQPLKIDIMLIKRKTIRRSRRGGSADGGGTQTVKVGENEYKQEGGVVSLPQYVTHIDDTIADRYPDNDGKVTLPKIPRSVSVNGSTYTPDSAGDIDLGNIGGGGGSVNSVSANGTTYTPDGSGDVNVGAMVKAIRYINTDYAPDADGKVTINSIAGYFASGLNGLNINGMTQAPLSYDPTTQHIRYDLDANNTTTSLRLMRNSGRNTDAEAYEITFEVVARVVSADDTATRIVAYIDTDVRGEASGLTWMLCLSRYVAGSTPLAIAIKGLADAPRYWTANDAKLRQGSYSGTSGFHCDTFDDDDLTQWSSAALAAHAEPLYEGHKRYMVDVTISAAKAVTVHAFDDVSRGAVGTAKVRVNGTTYTPDITGVTDLGNIGGGGGGDLMLRIALGGQSSLPTWYVIKIPQTSDFYPTMQFSGNRYGVVGQTDNGYTSHQTRLLTQWGGVVAVLIMPRANQNRAMFVYTANGLNTHFLWLGGYAQTNTHLEPTDLTIARSTTSASAAVSALEQSTGETYAEIEAVATTIDGDATIVDKASSEEYIMSVLSNGNITSFHLT